ncbi:MAG: ROK family protein [Clostridiales bacterium]|nr:ROK family protein [Clostridiales bacterium]
MYTIGVDIGGMSVKVGLVDDNGKIISQLRVKTEKTAEEVIVKMVDQINELLKNNSVKLGELRGIGIGCPGAVSSDKGIVEFLPNLGWESVPLVEKLKNYFNTEIKISNDANVAALGEVIYGAAKNYNDCIMFTLGTGVGGGIIIDKKLYEGGHSRGAELGHMTLFLGGKPCTCGRSGCIECYTSATALIGQTKEAMLTDKDSIMWDYVGGDIDKVDGKTAFECSKKGDKTAEKVRDTYIYYLGESILNMLNIFRPDAFILGGGISAQGEYLNERLKAYCEKFDYGYKRAPKTEIITATLGNDAGIIGAAALLR